MAQFFLAVNGPSCGGKSSVAKALASRIPGLFNAKRDHVKWLISDYASERYTDVLKDMLAGMIDAALAHGLSVVKEDLHEKPERLERLGSKHGVPIYFVNVTAPQDVLRARFRERIEAKKRGAKIANTSWERFELLRQRYENNKVSTPLEFDSSQQSPDGIAEKILSHIRGDQSSPGS